MHAYTKVDPEIKNVPNANAYKGISKQFKIQYNRMQFNIRLHCEKYLSVLTHKNVSLISQNLENFAEVGLLHKATVSIQYTIYTVENTICVNEYVYHVYMIVTSEVCLLLNPILYFF